MRHYGLLLRIPWLLTFYARACLQSKHMQAEPSAEARDKAAAEELWRLSEAAAGIAPGAYVPAEGKAGPAGAQ